MGVASPAQARQAQIARFLLVLGPEDVLALSKDTIGTAWASRVFFSKKYGLNSDETDLLFPQGNIDLIKFALEQLNYDLEVYCKQIDLIRLPIHKRIRKVLLSKISLMNKDKPFYRSIFLNLLIPKKNFLMTIDLKNISITME